MELAKILLKKQAKKKAIDILYIIERLYGDEIREAVAAAAAEVAEKTRKELLINLVVKLINNGVSKELVSKALEVPVLDIDEILANNTLKTNV